MRCSTVFVEPPNAISTAMASRNDSLVITFLAVTPLLTSSTIIIPVYFASLSLSAETAGAVPFPGSDMPIASESIFRVFAVNIPAQEPTPGQAAFSSSTSSS